MRVTLTTICGTDVHILKGEYPVRPGLVIGHEAVGVIHEIGPGVTGYQVGERVLVGAITLCGQCNACLGGDRGRGRGGGCARGCGRAVGDRAGVVLLCHGSSLQHPDLVGDAGGG